MAPRIYQVNQTNRAETRAGILCAPDDSRAGHDLMRQLRTGDVLFHYDSGAQSRLSASTHAVSVVEPVDLNDIRLNRFRNLIELPVVEAGECFVAYTGRHLTQDLPRGRYLFAFARLVRPSVSLPNAFPRQVIYLKEIDTPVGRHRAYASEVITEVAQRQIRG